MVLREEVHDGETWVGHLPKAELFVATYVLDGTDPATRPVTFAFNGGPGSSSVWLHLGLLGPRRVVMGDAGRLTPPPWGLADNAETLLAHTDLVFIDPVNAVLRGRARLRPPADPGAAAGQHRDAPLPRRPHDVRPRTEPAAPER